jgi:hypothetical protein
MHLTGKRGVVSVAGLGLAALLSAAGCADDGECVPTTEKQNLLIELPAEDPAMRFRVESCRVDKDACLPLCQRALGLPEPDLGGGGGGLPFFPDNSLAGCDVRFFESSVAVTAHVRTFQEECIFEADVPNRPIPIRPPI